MRLLDKLREFATEQLDDEERALFAALIAPGVALAYDQPDDEVVGYDVEWSPRRLPDHLAVAIRNRSFRIEEG